MAKNAYRFPIRFYWMKLEISRIGLYQTYVILPALVHFVVIPLVVAARYIVHPRLVVQIPADSFLYAFFKLQAGFPAKLTLEFS